MTLLEHWYTRNFWTGVNDYWQCQQQASVGSYWWMSWLHNFGKYWGQDWTYMFYFRRKASARHGMWVCVDCGGLDVSGPSPPLLPPLALRSMPPWVVVRAVGALGSLRPATGLQHMGKRCISLWQEGRELLIVAHKTSEGYFISHECSGCGIFFRKGLQS